MGVSVMSTSLVVLLFNIGSITGYFYKLGSDCPPADDLYNCDYYISALGQAPYEMYDKSAVCNEDTNTCECTTGFQVDGEITCCPTAGVPCVGGGSGSGSGYKVGSIGGPCGREHSIQKHAYSTNVHRANSSYPVFDVNATCDYNIDHDDGDYNIDHDDDDYSIDHDDNDDYSIDQDDDDDSIDHDDDDDDYSIYYDNKGPELDYSAYCDDEFYVCRCRKGTSGVLGSNKCTTDKVKPKPEIKISGGVGINTGEFCNPYLKPSKPCDDEHAECKPALDLSMRYICTCMSGYVAVYINDQPTVCYRELSETASGCRVCISNGGRCYDTNDNNKADGCVCPFTRSTHKKHCDTLHFEVECNVNRMEVCYKHKNQREHKQIYKDLKAGKAQLFIRDHSNELSCQLTRKHQHYCMTLSLSAPYRCGMTIHNTTRNLTYSTKVVLIQSRFHLTSYLTSYNLCVLTFCSFDKIRHTHSGLVEIAEHTMLASQGEHFKPEVTMTVRDTRSNDVTLQVINMGDDIRMHIELTDDNNGIYSALRAEVCVASNMLSLEHPYDSSRLMLLLLLNGCPYRPSASQSCVFHPTVNPSNNNLAVISDPFAAPRLGDSDFLFLHCAVRVCIHKDECHPYKCASRVVRSANNLNASADLIVSHVATTDLIKLLQNPDYRREVVRLRVVEIPIAVNTRKEELVGESGAVRKEVKMWTVILMTSSVCAGVLVLVILFTSLIVIVRRAVGQKTQIVV